MNEESLGKKRASRNWLRSPQLCGPYPLYEKAWGWAREAAIYIAFFVVFFVWAISRRRIDT